jgi:hypothetical protein
LCVGKKVTLYIPEKVSVSTFNNLSMKKISFALIIAFVLLKIACTQDDLQNIPISQTQIWNCYQSKTWTKDKVFNLLVGRWQWVYSENYSEGTGNSTKSENMIVEFFTDSTLLVTVNNRLGDTTKWIIVPKDGDLFGLQSDSSINQLQGRILNCGDVLEFNNSYIDGIDNYFERLEEVIEQDTTQVAQDTSQTNSN